MYRNKLLLLMYVVIFGASGLIPVSAQAQEGALQPGSATGGSADLPLKAEPSFGAGTIATVAAGEFVTVLEVEGMWAQVRYDDLTGWMIVGGLVNAEPGDMQLTTEEETVTLPEPSGAYQVGFTALEWVDDSREEIFTSDPEDHRSLTVWVWYPADVGDDSEASPYLIDVDIMRPGFESLAPGVAETVIEGLSDSSMHAFADAPVLIEGAPYPVVIFSNILSGLPVSQSFQLKDLASHGYIVIDVLHTFGYTWELKGVSGRIRTIRVGDPEISIGDFESIAVNDLRLVIDQLAVINSEDAGGIFAGTLIADQVGVVGYSLGGGVAMLAAVEDSRIRAGINEDGGPLGSTVNPISQPFLFMQAENSLGRYYNAATGPVYRFRADGMIHDSFGDYMFWPGVGGFSDALDGARTVEIINAYVVAFFDQYLKGDQQPLLAGPSEEFPEVRIDSQNVP